MKHIINLNNIKIPSLNHKHFIKKGRMILSKEYREFQKLLFYTIKKGYIESPYRLWIELETYLDFDNCLKNICDSLEKAGVIDNDMNIHEIKITKTPIRRGSPGRLDVWIGTIHQENKGVIHVIKIFL